MHKIVSVVEELCEEKIKLKMFNSGSSPSSPAIEDRMKSLTVDVVTPGANGRSRVGDSGYMSYAGGQHDTFLSTAVQAPTVVRSSNYTATPLMPSEYCSSSIVEAQLMPHLLQGTRLHFLYLLWWSGTESTIIEPYRTSLG
jgi:hypothetical protein